MDGNNSLVLVRHILTLLHSQALAKELLFDYTDGEDKANTFASE